MFNIKINKLRKIENTFVKFTKKNKNKSKI